MPKVSVLMPVYNGSKYLKEAIESILSQSFKDFEFLIINDGSTDNTENIIKSYKDQRIRYLKNPGNIGLVASLNKGIKLARGNYIARMDADDLSAETRLEKLTYFLDTHKNYGLVGSLFGLINKNRIIHAVGGAKLLGDEDLKFGMLFGNVFCHGETMYRRELMLKHKLYYDDNFKYCEDYELWTRMAKITKFQNLPELLYFYMENPEGVSGKKGKEMKANASKVTKAYKADYGIPKLTLAYAYGLIKSGKLYNDQFMNIGKKRVIAYLQLMRQVYIYRLAFAYLEKGRWDGLLLFPVSFLINPKNWFKQLFGMFPKPKRKYIHKRESNLSI